MASKKKYKVKRKVQHAWFDVPPPYSGTAHLRGDKRAGITFETTVGKELLDRGFPIVSDTWIKYKIYSGVKLCSPDHILIDVRKGIVTVIECKLSHTATAWFQLNHVYMPVLKKLFPGFTVRGVEICKNFSNTTRYPKEVKLVHDLNGDWTGGDNVLIWT
jgi:hypothetical protein